jgi:cobalamin biosynthesis protein CobC
VLSPCYAEHAEAWRRAGYIVREVMEQEVDFYLDKLDVLVVVNPNNPTGLSLSPPRLLDWHARLASAGAGWWWTKPSWTTRRTMSLAPQGQRTGLIVLRSFGKFFGLAGVRLGFVLAELKLLKLLAEQVGPWAVSGPTRVLGQVCLRDTEAHAPTPAQRTGQPAAVGDAQPVRVARSRGLRAVSVADHPARRVPA